MQLFITEERILKSCYIITANTVTKHDHYIRVCVLCRDVNKARRLLGVSSQTCYVWLYSKDFFVYSSPVALHYVQAVKMKQGAVQLCTCNLLQTV